MYVSSKVDFLCNIIVITGVMHAVRTQETSSACPADALSLAVYDAGLLDLVELSSSFKITACPTSAPSFFS